MTWYVNASAAATHDGTSWATAFRTVQDGLAAAVGGDELWVVAGTYAGPVTLRSGVAVYGGFAGTEVLLSQRNPAANTTVLDGGAAGPVVTAGPEVTQTATLDGFTIRNGSGLALGGVTFGGGVLCRGATVSLTGNVITGNTASGYGGGVAATNSALTLGGNVLSGNSAPGGGGLYVEGGSLVASGNRFSGNSSARYGGGALLYATAASLSFDCFEGNTSGYAGGGLFADSAGVMLAGALFRDNTATVSGGGIFASQSSVQALSVVGYGNTAHYGGALLIEGGSLSLVNATLADNLATAAGGGILLSWTAPASVSSSIIAFNSSGLAVSGGEPALSANDVFDNGGRDYDGLLDPTGTGGNISGDPLFQDRARRNYRLRTSSPCRDAGDDAAAPAGAKDADGQPRSLGTHVDIGAYEFTVPLPAYLSFNRQPGGAPAGSPLNPQPVVHALDASRNLLTSFNGPVTVTLTTSPAGAVLSGTTTVLAVNGVATFNDLAVDRPGSCRLTASAGATVASSAFVMTPVPVRLSFQTQPGASLSGNPLNPQPVVAVLDANGDRVTVYSGPVTLSIRPGTGAPAASLVGTVTKNAISGLATFTDISVSKPGASYVLTADSGTLAPASSAPFTVGAGVLYVRPDGNDTNDGQSWASALRTVSAAEAAAILLPGAEVWVAAGTYAGPVTMRAHTALYGGFAGAESSRAARDWRLNPTVLDGGGKASVVTLPAGSDNRTVLDGFTVRNGSGVNGGGVSAASPNSATVRHNIIVDNIATGDGGGVWCGGAVSVRDNLIARNRAARGGGIHAYLANNIVGNTIVANAATANGGGLSFGPNISPLVSSNVVSLNSSGWYWATPASYQPMLRNNDTYGNAAYDFSAGTNPGTQNGNKTTDPLLRDPANGDYRLGIGSPCINAGEAVQYQSGSLDLDARPRLQGTTIDIGAYERDMTPLPAGVIAVAAKGNDVNDGRTWSLAKATIKGAISAAAAGSEIWVAGGIYAPFALKSGVSVYGGFAGSETVRAARVPSADPTVVDAALTNYQGAQTCISADATVTLPVTVDGFTLRNGLGGSGAVFFQPCGGGVLNLGGSVTVSNTAIMACYGYSGGGVYSQGGTLTLLTCAISGNTSKAAGAGVMANGGTVTVIGCRISDNVSETDGGGVCGLAGTIGLNGCTILNNAARNRGGGVYATSTSATDVTLIGNAIGNNSASVAGGVYLAGPATLANNTIAGNADTGVGLYGQPVTAVNNIVAFNAGAGFTAGSASGLTLRNNDVIGNAAGEYVGFPDPTGQTGNIRLDPRLASLPHGNLHLQPDSPCRGAGDPAATPAGAIDIDGQPLLSGGTVDIGADASDGSLWTVVPRVIRVSTSGSDADDGSTWAAAKRSVRAALALAGEYDEVWVAAGVYDENVAIPRAVGLFGGFSGNETDRGQRNPAIHVTVLDGGRRSSVVQMPAARAVLDGFTIRNGVGTVGSAYGASGGGVYVLGADCVIRHNVITQNYLGPRSLPTGLGGGVYANTSVTLENNDIVDNWSSSSGGVFVDGVQGPRSVTISGGSFRANYSTNGGTAVSAYGDCKLDGVSVAGNSGRTNPAVSLRGPTATITNCFVSGNAGDGIVSDALTTTVANVTAVGNASAGLKLSGVATVANSIAAFNANGIVAGATPPELNSNCVHGNTAGDYIGVTNPGSDNGNLNVDPRLANRWGSAHVQSGSPCVNAGNNAAVVGPTDIDGQPRVQAGRVDIGADEADGTVWPTLPRVIRVSPSGGDSADGSSWAAAKASIGGALLACRGGEEIWLAAGVYTDHIYTKPGVSLLGGFVGTESDRSARDPRRNVAVIDGGQSAVEPVMSSEFGDVVLDGLTVRGGVGGKFADGRSRGGALHIAGGPIAVRGCTFRENSGGTAIAIESGQMLFLGNTVTANTVPPTAYIPNVMECRGGTATLASNVFAANSGGALYFTGGAIRAINNTITGNTGTGVFFSTYCDFSNNIVAYNRVGLSLSYWGPPVMSANDIYGNLDADYKGMADATGQSGNIRVDPLLESRFRGGHIQPASPCRGAGDAAAVAGEVDIDGQPRTTNGLVDIGADQSDGATWPDPARVIHVLPTGNDNGDGLSWVGAKRTIGAALAVARGRDELWVAQGTYVENVAVPPGVSLYGGFAGDEIQRANRDPKTRVTVLDGGGAAPVVTAPYMGVLLDGFTIRNGYGAQGAGIYAPLGILTASNNVITGNAGAGVGVTAGVATITGNTISANIGGLYLDNSFQVTGNVITGNKTVSSAGGLGVSGVGTISGNTISLNECGAYGGGIYAGGGTVTIRDNIISANKGWKGAALWTEASTDLLSNLITGNMSSDGGVVYYRFGGGRMVNNTVVDNTSFVAFQGGTVLVQNNIITNTMFGVIQSYSTYTFLNNDVWGNSGGNYTGMPNPTGLNGNISVDPQFVARASGNYRLAPGSPCIDAGDDAALGLVAFDLDGKARPRGAHTDIGAYEFAGAPFTTADVETALRVVAGTAASTPSDISRLNVVTTGSSLGVLDIADAVRIARKAAGLEANP